MFLGDVELIDLTNDLLDDDVDWDFQYSYLDDNTSKVNNIPLPQETMRKAYNVNIGTPQRTIEPSRMYNPIPSVPEKSSAYNLTVPHERSDMLVGKNIPGELNYPAFSPQTAEKSRMYNSTVPAKLTDNSRVFKLPFPKQGTEKSTMMYNTASHTAQPARHKPTVANGSLSARLQSGEPSFYRGEKRKTPESPFHDGESTYSVNNITKTPSLRPKTPYSISGKPGGHTPTKQPLGLDFVTASQVAMEKGQLPRDLGPSNRSPLQKVGPLQTSPVLKIIPGQDRLGNDERKIENECRVQESESKTSEDPKSVASTFCRR